MKIKHNDTERQNMVLRISKWISLAEYADRTFYKEKHRYSGLENRDYGRRGSAALTMRHPSIRKRWH
jgi:hypothetical protein